MRRVVVTGMGIVSSIGGDVGKVTDALREGKSGITFSEEFARYNFRSRVWGAPATYMLESIPRKAKRFMGIGSQWNHVAMTEAIKSAGLSDELVSNENTGIIMGSGGPSTSAIVAAADITRVKGPRHIGAYKTPQAMSSTASATLAVPFGIKGINYTITSACATSAHCIRSAAIEIMYGDQYVMFAGGSEEVGFTLANTFDAMPAMSSKYNDTPERASRAFDQDRDGFVIAGGAGVLVLEELEHALARETHIIAELVGFGATSDGHDMVHPSGEGAVRCMRQALRDAQCSVDYINPHGTSTPVGDAAEIKAIREVFGNEIPYITSTKSLTGHSLGAAGAQEAIYSLIMMEEGFITSSVNIENLDPKFEDIRNKIVHGHIDTEVNCVLSNSFGFGGTNATLVFARLGQ